MSPPGFANRAVSRLHKCAYDTRSQAGPITRICLQIACNTVLNQPDMRVPSILMILHDLQLQTPSPCRESILIAQIDDHNQARRGLNRGESHLPADRLVERLHEFAMQVQDRRPVLDNDPETGKLGPSAKNSLARRVGLVRAEVEKEQNKADIGFAREFHGDEMRLGAVRLPVEIHLIVQEFRDART